MTISLSSKKKVLIVGINGQDGSFLAEELVKKEYEIIGIGRQKNLRKELKGIGASYFQIDLLKDTEYEAALYEIKPDIIIYTAAIHGAHGFDYASLWREAHLVNTICVHLTLEYIRTTNSVKFLYFSSSKVFWPHNLDLITESSDKKSTCIYTATKNSASNILNIYKKQYGIKGATFYLFNHESYRRRHDYFIPRIVHILASSLSNKKYQERVNTLDFWCDWGDAKEYMSIVCELLHLQKIEDFVIASGTTYWGRDFVSELFYQHGLDYRDHVLTNFKSDKEQHKKWTVDVTAIKSAINKVPTKSPFDICDDILSKNYNIRLPKEKC